MKYYGVVGFVVVWTLLAGNMVHAENATSSTTSITTKLFGVNATCMQSAIEKRDTAILKAFDEYVEALRPTIVTREGALKDAWGFVERKTRVNSLKDAWGMYKKDQSRIVSTWRTAKRSAWNVFYIDRRACGPSALIDDSTNHAVDSDI